MFSENGRYVLFFGKFTNLVQLFIFKIVIFFLKKIAGFNSNELNPSEVRKIQMQTLLDIAKDVEADQIYQTVTKNIKTVKWN